MNLNASCRNDNLISEIFISNHGKKKNPFAASCVGFIWIDVLGLGLTIDEFSIKMTYTNT